MKAYCVEYKIHEHSEVKRIAFLASNKYDAYDKATYELIPAKEDGYTPYSSWVYSVTYNNGNVHYFNTCEGMAY